MKNEKLIKEIIADMQASRIENARKYGTQPLEISESDDREFIREVLAFEDGISSAEDFKAYSLFNLYSDCYKDENGIRPRWLKWDDHTLGEWEEMIEKINQD